MSKKRKKRNIRQHGKIKEDKTTSRIFAGSFLLAIKIEFATQTHLKKHLLWELGYTKTITTQKERTYRRIKIQSAMVILFAVLSVQI